MTEILIRPASPDDTPAIVQFNLALAQESAGLRLDPQTVGGRGAADVPGSGFGALYARRVPYGRAAGATDDYHRMERLEKLHAVVAAATFYLLVGLFYAAATPLPVELGAVLGSGEAAPGGRMNPGAA